MGLLVVLEEEDAIVFLGEVLQLIPGTRLETLESLVLPKLLPHLFFCCVLDLVLELHLVIISHHHFYSLGLLL